MNPKFKSKQAWFIGWLDLQDIIAKHYKIGQFEILDTPNDSTHRFEVESCDPDDIDGYDAEIVQNAIDEESVNIWQLGLVLQDMCTHGAINAGTYIVDVCW